MVAVPAPLPYLNQCKASYIVVVCRSLLFVIDAQTFQITSSLYPPPLLGMSTIVVHTNSSAMCPSWNTNLVILTILSQCSIYGYFSLVASLSHAFNNSAIMPDVPTTHTVRSLFTATTIPSPSGSLSAIINGRTNMGISSPSGGLRL